jgi:nicotinamide mononucleotide transporter
MTDFFSVDNIAFSIAGQGVSFLEVLAVITGLGCVYLASQRRVLNFWFGYTYNFLLFFLFLQKGLYSSMILQPVSIAINLYGHYRWTHPRKEETNKNRELKISLLTNKSRFLYVGSVIIWVVLWGTFLLNIHSILPAYFNEARQPYLDSFVTGMILIAQYLSAQKKLECWAAWLVVNITNVVLYLLAGLAFMPMVSAAYLVLAFFGFAMWKRQWEKEKV